MKKLICLLSLVAFFATGNLLCQPDYNEKPRAFIRFDYVEGSEIASGAIACFKGINEGKDAIIGQAMVLKIGLTSILVQEKYFDLEGNIVYKGLLEFSKKGDLIGITSPNGFSSPNLFSPWPVKSESKTRPPDKIEAKMSYLYAPGDTLIPIEAVIYIEDVVIGQARVLTIKKKYILVEEIYPGKGDNIIYHGQLKFNRYGKLTEIIKIEGKENSPRQFTTWPVKKVYKK